MWFFCDRVAAAENISVSVFLTHFPCGRLNINKGTILGGIWTFKGFIMVRFCHRLFLKDKDSEFGDLGPNRIRNRKEGRKLILRFLNEENMFRTGGVLTF